MKPVKTSGMIKAKEVIMKSKKMKQQLELNIINKQQQQQQPKRVALHQTVESVFKATPGSTNKSILATPTTIPAEELKDTTEASSYDAVTNNEVSFKNTTLSEDALETIFNRVKSHKEHKASNAINQHEKAENSNSGALKASPVSTSTSRRPSLSDDDDPKVRDINKKGYMD